ncbi:MAG: hypothetical protein K6A69_05770 [Lachnospiraceae bacterium]|nr:hypothetical protein [Lachnospiraceae bacterium]
MPLIAVKKNERIHAKGAQVNTLEVLLQGSVTISDGKSKMKVSTGSLIGVAEVPGETYQFEYIASEDCKMGVYPYKSDEDIEKVVKVNPKIAPVLASAMIKTAREAFNGYEAEYDHAMESYNKLQADASEYPNMVKALGETPKQFPEIAEIEEPFPPERLAPWMKGFLDEIMSHEDYFTKYIYAMGTDMVAGFIMLAVTIVNDAVIEYTFLKEYEKGMQDISTKFRMEYTAISNRMKSIRNVNEIKVNSDDVPDFSSALESIMTYAELSPADMDGFRQVIDDYKSYEDRTEMTDVMRRLRRDITDRFFRLYEKAYFRSAEDMDTDVPPEVNMFLMFGFVDQDLAGRENTEILYHVMETYEPDPTHVAVTMPEWLDMIYDGVVMPSKNEFDLDYPSQLKEWRIQGEITPAQEERLLKDQREKVKFEIHNFFKVGDRMTFGRVTSFIPIFDSVNVLKPLDTAYLQNSIIHEKLDLIRGIDYSLFSRNKDYNNEALGISHYQLDKEVLPYMILMPNMGIRIALWQEIEGKKRDTSARFLLPIFMAEDPLKGMLSACGEYRWEMCKTVQGVHWNDLSDPSLTAEYADYIQYYRKNHYLNAEQKEKIKKTLQKVSNNLRRAFVADYLVYMSSESNGSPVMNKVAREILFKYAPFSAPIRKKISANPQYAEFLKKHESAVNQKLRPLLTIMKKIETSGGEIPEELREQKRYLAK